MTLREQLILMKQTYLWYTAKETICLIRTNFIESEQIMLNFKETICSK